MMNLQLIERQPQWRVWLVAVFAQIIGVCIHVEGIPFGSTRTRKERTEVESCMGTASGGVGKYKTEGGGATGI